MEGCGMSCIKYLLFFFNFLFVVAGLGIIIAGGLVLKEASYSLLEGITQGPPIALIVVGVIIFITAFLGCCGAIKENYCMLITFAVILIVIFIMQMAVGITAAVYKDTLRDEIKKELNDSMRTYEDKLTREAWDEAQSNLKCCGINGPNDWLAVGFQGEVPASCCNETDPTTSSAHQTCRITKVAYKRGCYDELAMLAKKGMVVIMAVAIGIAFIELAGSILACFLAKNIQREKEVDVE